jgi:hypothetical protein
MDLVSLDRNLQTQVDNLAGKLIVVNSQADRDRVSADVKDAKLMKATVINFLKNIKESAHRTWKGICDMESTNTAKCDAYIKAADKAILIFDDAEQAKRDAEIKRQQEIAANAEADAAAARALAEDAEDNSSLSERNEVAIEADEAAQVAMQAMNTAAQLEFTPVVRKQAGESVRAIWHARVVNAALVPREYLIPDEKSLEALAKARKALSTIPGVEFYSEQTRVTRY